MLVAGMPFYVLCIFMLNKLRRLTECMNICKNLNVKCVPQGVPNVKEQLVIKKAIWNKNDKEIRAELDKSYKVRSIVIPKLKKKQRNYLKRMNLPDVRTWFRFRCKTTNNLKGNTSSTFRNNV